MQRPTTRSVAPVAVDQLALDLSPAAGPPIPESRRRRRVAPVEQQAGAETASEPSPPACSPLTLTLSAEQTEAMIALVAARIERPAAALRAAAALDERADADRRLTVEEVAERARVSQRTVYRALYAGRLRGEKVGVQWRIATSALAEWMRPVKREPPPARERAPQPGRRARSALPSSSPLSGRSFTERVRASAGTTAPSEGVRP